MEKRQIFHEAPAERCAEAAAEQARTNNTAARTVRTDALPIATIGNCIAGAAKWRHEPARGPNRNPKDDHALARRRESRSVPTPAARSVAGTAATRRDGTEKCYSARTDCSERIENIGRVRVKIAVM